MRPLTFPSSPAIVFLMTVIAIPKALRERLGEEGSQGLVDIISAIDERAREDSLRLLSERFERRLSDELGKVNERITGLDEKITNLEERFERRLSEEIGKVNERLTLEIGKINERITAEIGKLDERITIEMGKVNGRITSLEERFERRLSEEIGKVNERITVEIGKVNERITAEIGGLRQDMERFRSELIKWMFIFWVGQIAVIGGLIVGVFNLAR